MPAQTAKLNVTPRVLAEARRQAVLLANRIKTYYTTDRIKSWTDIENQLKIEVPEIFKSQPFNWQTCCSGHGSFCAYWTATFELRLNAALTTQDKPLAEVHKPKIIQQVSTFGVFTLKPEQEGTFRSIYNAFFPADKNKPYLHAALQDGYPGAGKTPVAIAVIAQMIKDGVLNRPEHALLFQPIMIFTPRTLVEHWRRHIEDFGLAEYLNKGLIAIFSQGTFTSDFGKTYCDFVEDTYTGEETLQWSRALIPLLCIYDESHGYNSVKSHRTQCMLALYRRSKITRFLHLSATPGEKINDMLLLTVQARKNLLGTFVDENSFKYFAQLITPRPDKPNREAMKKYRRIMVEAGVIHSMPYVKPKYKAINILELFEFASPKDKEIYDRGVEHYLEACRKMGKNTAFGRFQRNVELAIFRRTVEPLRAPAMAQRAADNFHAGTYATAIGVEFKETITSVAFLLIDKYGLSRDDISVIWGGRKEFKKEDLIPKPELDRLFRTMEIMKHVGDKAFMRRVKISVRYEQDQIEHNETFEEQADRHAKLRELKLLGNQSLNTRQIEIDNFQDNTTRVCLFTAATGGVGLSLDRSRPDQLVREGLFSLGLSGKVFKQLLGRLVRRNSISDAIQRICAMRNTVEHWFLAPLIDKKLKCIAELTSTDLELDIEELMRQQPAAKDYAAASLAEALSRADEDNTIVADFAKVDEPEPGDEDDENGDDDIEEIING